MLLQEEPADETSRKEAPDSQNSDIALIEINLDSNINIKEA